MRKQWKQWDFIFLGSKITADGDCSHEIKRHLLLGRKSLTNLDSILKSRDITFLTKFPLVKAMVFPVSQFFESGGQSIGVSVSTSVLPMNVQHWVHLGLTSWIFLQSKGLSRVSSNTKVKSINSSVLSFPYSPTLTSIHDHWKNHSFD